MIYSCTCSVFPIADWNNKFFKYIYSIVFKKMVQITASTNYDYC